MQHSANLLGLSGSWINFTCFNDAEKCYHVRLGLFSIREDIGALLLENTRNTIE